MNLVIFSGNLAKDARLVEVSTGKKFCATTLALREDLRPENKSPVFVDIIIWGERAEKLVNYLTKGKAVSVIGRLDIVKTTKNNVTYVTPRVIVDTLEFLGKKTVESVTVEQPAEKLAEDVVENPSETDSSEEVPF